ncbi:MAG TPA: chorismate mutase [Tepiditoga sp.]|mgnify:CR=1 FL=1|nr:chorismate mutase [Tepiditoga sp.]
MNCIRGAVSVDNYDKNHIEQRVNEMFSEIMKENDIEKIYSIIFSVTPDIKTVNPATIVRKSFNLDKTAFMCFQEAMFENSPEKIIRILVNCESRKIKYVYLYKAADLRNIPEVHDDIQSI